MLLLLLPLSLSLTTTATCFYTDGVADISSGVLDRSGDAWAIFEDTIDSIGFHRISIESNPSSDGYSQVFCAGFVDGFLTQHRIYERFLLYKDIENISRSTDFPPRWLSWLSENMAFMRSEISAHPSDPYWLDIGLVVAQFDGLVAGYSLAAPDSEQLRSVDLQIIQSIGDIYDLEPLWNSSFEAPETYGMECSGLIRVAPDLSDVYFAHNTWSDFRKMTNIVKDYRLPVPGRTAQRVVVTTKMGALPSSEDFWLTDRGLLFFETTNANYNRSLYARLTPQSLLTWVRVLHAAWTADSGSGWADAFLRNNSGTYNNQYVVLDAKRFSPGATPPAGLVWITETMPGIAMRRDVTDIVNAQGYWASFNSPWFREIAEAAGYPEKIAEAGDLGSWYSYANCSRHRIFARDAPNVKTFAEFKKLMNANRWADDPLSNGDSAQQPMARYDLRGDDCKWGKRRAYGGLDVKATTALRALAWLSFDAIASPTHEDQPPFDFAAEEWAGLRHDGLPALWNFSWGQFAAEGFDKCAAESRAECLGKDACGWCIYSQKCLLGFAGGPALGQKCEAGWVVRTQLQPWAVPLIAGVSGAVVLLMAIIYGNHFVVTRRIAQYDGL